MFTADRVNAITTEGAHADGGGLYLKVSGNGAKSWIYRYQIAKRRRSMGLGGYPKMTLAKARMARDVHQKQVKAGIDPLEVKRGNETQAELERKRLASQAELNRKHQEALQMTFRRCAEDYIEQKKAGWKNAKHTQQWTNTLLTYAYPIIGDVPVARVEIEHLREILTPIWQTKTETATRVRNRIELVLDYACTLQHRAGDNPARWRGNLANVLPTPTKLKEVRHHAALPYDEVPDFMDQLSQERGLAAQALIFTILTAARTSESLDANWNEFDLDKRVWIIPKARMKAGKAHRIPLSASALELLKALPQFSTTNYVFPGIKEDKHLSNMSMTNVLRRMGRRDLTVHGFRSTFRDWIAEKTNYPQRVAESALAHKLKDGAEAAYQRGDLLEQRADMMETWARYCIPKKSKVVPIRKRQSG